MKYFKVLYGCVALTCMVSGGVIGRTALQHRDGSYVAGKIAGRVETIFNNLSLDVEHKRRLLRQELSHAQQLKLDTLSQKITAMLGLLVVQGKSMEPYITAAEEVNTVGHDTTAESDIFDTPESLVTATLAGETDDQPAVQSAATDGEAMSVESIAAFGNEVIERAAAYSDRLMIVGTPSVSRHRAATFALFIRSLRADNDALIRAQDAVKVCTKIYTLLDSNKTLQAFVAAFKKHIEKKYAAVVTDIEGNIKFKIFEILAYLGGDETQTAEDIVGDFLVSYNSYVTAQNTIQSDELAFPVREWAHMLLTTDQVVKHIMLVLSFAMEQVKHDVQREPLVKQLHDDVSVQTTEALTLLEQDGVAVSDEERLNPMELAQKCSDQVQVLLTSRDGAFAKEQQERVERYVNLVDQISQLTSDYDLVVREMADTAALNRLTHDISQLPESEQEILKKSSSLDPAVLQEIVPAFSDDQEFEESEPVKGLAPRKRRGRMSTGAKVGLGLGVSAAILLILWQGIAMKMKLSEEESNVGSAFLADSSASYVGPVQNLTFWDMLTKAGPIGFIAPLW
jgi:hypothetical protein